MHSLPSWIMDIDFDFDNFFSAPETIPQYVLKVYGCDVYENVLTILNVFSLAWAF